MTKFSSLKKSSIKCEMNVVPFIDISLVLLLIFMATSTAEKSSVQVDLPKSHIPQKQVSAKDVDKSVILSLSKNNELYVTSSYIGVIDKKIKTTELPGLLALLKNDSEATEIMVRADANTRYQSLVEVIEQVKKSNHFKVKLVTETE